MKFIPVIMFLLIVFTHVVAGASINTRNNGLFSTTSHLWDTEVTGMNELTGGRHSLARIVSELNLYIPLFKDSNIVIANRIGGGITFGNTAFF